MFVIWWSSYEYLVFFLWLQVTYLTLGPIVFHCQLASISITFPLWLTDSVHNLNSSYSIIIFLWFSKIAINNLRWSSGRV